MELSLEIQKKMTSDWFKFIQYKICEEFQYFENEFAKKKKY